MTITPGDPPLWGSLVLLHQPSVCLGVLSSSAYRQGWKNPPNPLVRELIFASTKDFLSNCNKLSFEKKKVYVKGLLCKETLVPLSGEVKHEN